MIRSLIVEDDFRVAEIHSAYVSQIEGFQVIGIAPNAALAYAMVIEHKPDLVFLDLFLPDEHGLELFARLQQLPRGSKPDVFVITAARDAQSVKEAIQLGAVNYIVKPFSAHQFTERLLAYKTAFTRLVTSDPVSQAEVDAAVAMFRGKKLESFDSSAARNPTTESILKFLASQESARSASEVSEQLGISRATAQRYLSQMVDRKLLSLELQYGTAGRPINKYKRVK